jgi:hypothetical protein
MPLSGSLKPLQLALTVGDRELHVDVGRGPPVVHRAGTGGVVSTIRFLLAPRDPGPPGAASVSSRVVAGGVADRPAPLSASAAAET